MDRTDPDASQPLMGRDNTQPGYWAEAALDNPWSRGRRNSYNNKATLHELRQGHLLREPGLRESRAHFDGPRFYRVVASKTEIVEAPLSQATSPKVAPEQQCDACKLEKGPFVSCVIAPGSFRECANCHWSQ